MATRRIAKGSSEANFFSEFLMFRQKYYEPEKSEEFFEEVIREAKVITDKYENEPFGEFARSVVLCHIADLDKRDQKSER